MTLVALAITTILTAITPIFEPEDTRSIPIEPMLSAHNCYPYNGLWADRIERAIATGTPLAIEQDLCWVDRDGEMTSIVSHGDPFDGSEPTLETHFFDRLAPIVDPLLANGDESSWPVIVLDLDLKNSDEDHCRAIDRTLRAYEDWFCWAPRAGDAVEPMRRGPVLITLSGKGAQQAVFHDDLEPGERIIAFGAARTSHHSKDPSTLAPDEIVTEPASNFRRWWNNSWHVVESGGARGGGDWTTEDQARLDALVDHAHAMGYWIRFYTINGCAPSMSTIAGWSPSYNTGDPTAARARWAGAVRAGVDFIASDQYEDAADTIRKASNATR